jgi:hypothetical protein
VKPRNGELWFDNITEQERRIKSVTDDTVIVYVINNYEHVQLLCTLNVLIMVFFRSIHKGTRIKIVFRIKIQMIYRYV